MAIITIASLLCTGESTVSIDNGILSPVKVFLTRNFKNYQLNKIYCVKFQRLEERIAASLARKNMCAAGMVWTEINLH